MTRRTPFNRSSPWLTAALIATTGCFSTHVPRLDRATIADKTAAYLFGRFNFSESSDISMGRVLLGKNIPTTSMAVVLLHEESGQTFFAKMIYPRTTAQRDVYGFAVPPGTYRLVGFRQRVSTGSSVQGRVDTAIPLAPPRGLEKMLRQFKVQPGAAFYVGDFSQTLATTNTLMKTDMAFGAMRVEYTPQTIEIFHRYHPGFLHTKKVGAFD